MYICYFFFFFKQKTSYEVRISDWSSDVCSSDLLTAPRKEFIPTANIAKAVGWKANEKPVAPKGLMVERFADGLAHPRSMLRLGNGDILVAETGSPKREVGGITGIVMNFLMGKAGADATSPNRIILLIGRAHV